MVGGLQVVVVGGVGGVAVCLYVFVFCSFEGLAG
jgi:hypothetical protein